MGIYKRKQASKKTRKQELDQESHKEKKKVFSFFLGRVLVFLFLDRFLGRVLVFFFFSCFLDHFLSRVLVFFLVFLFS